MTEDEFRDLYQAMTRPVYLYAHRQLGPEAAKDIVSETFTTAWAKRSEFPAGRDDWPAWVVGIARNKVLQEFQRRRRKHHDGRFIADWIGPTREPSTEDPSRQVLETVAGVTVFQSLSPAEQDLFGIAFFKELLPEQGANLLAISVTAYTSRVSRLRQRIRELSAKASSDHDPNESSRAGT